MDAPGARPLSRMPEVVWSLRRQRELASRLRLREPEDKPPRRISLKLSVTETDFVVLEDVTSLDSNAVVLKVSANISSVPSLVKFSLSFDKEVV